VQYGIKPWKLAPLSTCTCPEEHTRKAPTHEHVLWEFYRRYCTVLYHPNTRTGNLHALHTFTPLSIRMSNEIGRWEESFFASTSTNFLSVSCVWSNMSLLPSVTIVVRHQQKHCAPTRSFVPGSALCDIKTCATMQYETLKNVRNQKICTVFPYSACSRLSVSA